MLEEDDQLPLPSAEVRESLPFVTGALPGCGGQLKAVPEDFEVDEIPAYEPNGEGEHLFLWVQKNGRSTPEVAKALAAALGIGERDVSYAGLKDRQAVTRQFFSVPAKAEAQLALVSDSRFQVLSAKRHRNKLKTGHLRGNRFRIRLRDVKDAGAAKATVAALEKTGMPNFFGTQRFGRYGDNAEKGLAMLRGERLPATPSRFERKMFLSAAQSQLFNLALAARIREGTFAQALLGDVMKKLETGGIFVCTDVAADQPRVERFEISPAGPLFGPKMEEASGAVAESEGALLKAARLSDEDLKRGRGETEGGRRPYRIPLRGLALEPSGQLDLWLSFELPRGSYATVLIRELQKPG